MTGRWLGGGEPDLQNQWQHQPTRRRTTPGCREPPSWPRAGLVFLAHLVLMPAGSAQVPRLTGPDHPGPFTDLRQWSGPDLRSDASERAPVQTPRGRPRADLHRPGPDLLYRFVGEHRFSLTGHSVAFADDVNCDGFSEVIIGAANYLEAPGAAYLISMADVEASDAADGVADGGDRPRRHRWSGAFVETRRRRTAVRRLVCRLWRGRQWRQMSRPPRRCTGQ